MFEIYSAISEIYLLIYILLYDFIMKIVKKNTENWKNCS